MLSAEQIRSFDENGYIVIPNVLSPEQVQSLRTALRPVFNRPPQMRHPGDTDHLLFDIFSRHVDLRWLFFHEPTLAILRSLLGEDFVVLREAAAHLEQFGGWHKDTTSQELEGHTFQWKDDYLMVEVAYYLQDNSTEYGGGLDVQPGSHRESDRFAHPPRSGGRLRRLLNQAITRKQRATTTGVAIPQRAGDLVIFHFRINHRATPRKNQAPPRDREKMAIFTAYSRNNEHVKAYHDFIASRASYVYLKGFAYPEDLSARCRQTGITLA